jgi:peptide-methionine (S)-S-oxide reductase
VVFDPALTSYQEMLRVFWENHDPTQGMRQGNDVGTQYRSAIYTFSDTQKASAHSTRDAFYYFAEHYHQQYLAKNPNGYCGMGGTGASLPSS